MEELHQQDRSLVVRGRVGRSGAGAADAGSAPAFEGSFDACVVAVPLPHARRLLTGVGPVAGPALAILDRLGQGDAAKLHVPLLAPAGPGAVLDVPGRWWCWTARDGGPAASPVLNSFAGSAETLGELAVDGGPATWAARLAELRPELALDLSRALVTTWHDDPWALGSYSYPRAGAWPGGEPVEPELRERVLGGLVLAGEWTAGAWSGLMEGALRTGERAAADVLGLLAAS